jgi:SAM-dependent methyltransferase
MLAASHPRNAKEWEAAWAPYDESTYQAVLNYIRPADRLLEIGAGDLRLAKRLAGVARLVYAIEINPNVLARAVQPLPNNLIVILGDALTLEFPTGITCGVLMMRHCSHFRLYAQKLKDCGATRLISNARWRFDPEEIDLTCKRSPYERFGMGWYACWCGATGFKEGPVEKISPELMEVVSELRDCPECYLERGN